MATIIPDVGREYVTELLTGLRSGEKLYTFAIGTGTTSPSTTDTALANEVYRSTIDDSNCDIEETTTDGELLAKLTVSGGTEVPAGTTITEFGLFTDGSPEALFYREVRSGNTIDSGVTLVFQIDIDVDEVTS